MSLAIGPPPQDIGLNQLISIIWNIFYNIENEFYYMQVERVHAEPARPQDGQLAYADGTDWDPGAGKGVYRYDSDTTSWVLLG